MVKSLLCAYLIVFALLLRVSHLIVLPVVTIVGSPFFLIYYCIWVRQEVSSNNSQQVEDQYNQESAKKQLNPDSSAVASAMNSARLRHNQVGDEEVLSARHVVAFQRESMAPIIVDNSANPGEAELANIAESAVEDHDVVEQLRRESIDLRVNPVGMRRALFKLQTSFYKARKKQEKEIKRLGPSAPVTKLTDECSVCLVNFSDNDQVCQLPCNIDHLFHIECLLNWANHNYTCPICRQSIITSRAEINFYALMQQRNLMNQHEDDLSSGVMRVQAEAGFAEAAEDAQQDAEAAAAVEAAHQHASDEEAGPDAIVAV